MTVPRQWTGVSVTNQSEDAVHNAAQFVFVSTSDPQDVILVDMMYAPSLQSRGFMHTMWFDQHRATERKACSGCGRFYMIEFYEPQFAYSVVELSPKGDGIYGFVKELMSLLETVQQREGSAK